MRPPGIRKLFLIVFVGLAIGTCGAFSIGLFMAYRRLNDPELLSPLLSAGIVGVFAAILLTAAAWLFFDDNIAKPVIRIAAAFRARAHGGVSGEKAKVKAPYLGDLAPAADALGDSLTEAREEMDARLAEETAVIEAEKAQLAAILSEIPVAIMAISAAHQVTLYDRQCVHALGHVAPLGLDHSVFDYIQEKPLRAALDQLAAQSGHNFADVDLPLAGGIGTVRARLRLIGRNQGYVLAMEVDNDVMAERPLVFDFSLIDRTATGALAETPLSRLRCVVFDTETTGLSPQKDEIVQIGAVRVVNGRIVEGESFESLVNPGRPIPPASIRVHGVTNEMVANAPCISDAGRKFHDFARGAVLVAHNAPFDLAFLRRHEQNIGRSFEFPVLDTVLLSAALFGESAEHTLDAIAERLDVAIEGAARHTAIGDAVATAAVLTKMLPMAQAMGIETFGDAVNAMRQFQRLLPDINQT